MNFYGDTAAILNAVVSNNLYGMLREWLSIYLLINISSITALWNKLYPSEAYLAAMLYFLVLIALQLNPRTSDFLYNSENGNVSLSRLIHFVLSNLTTDTGSQTEPCRKTLMDNYGLKAIKTMVWPAILLDSFFFCYSHIPSFESLDKWEWFQNWSHSA